MQTHQTVFDKLRMPERFVSVHQFGQQTAPEHIDELSGSAQRLLCAENFGEQWIEIGLAVAAKKGG